MKTYILIISLFTTLSINAQKVFYIYFQSENNAPFYAKLSDKVYSSSSGYIIISGLIDSSYNISVGNPAGQDTKYLISLNAKDHGFMVRNTGTYMSLTDMETNSTLKPLSDPNSKNVTYENHNDAFTTLLSKAASDSSLLRVPVPMKQETTIASTNSISPEEQKKEVVKTKEEPQKNKINEKTADSILKKDTTKLIAQAKPDTTKIAIETNVTNKTASGDLPKSHPSEEMKPAMDTLKETGRVVKTEEESSSKKEQNTVPVKEIKAAQANEEYASVYKRSKVIKHSESSTSVGFGLVFFDNDGSSIDTIRLLIPNPKFQLDQNDAAVQTETNNAEKEKGIKDSPVSSPANSSATKTNISKDNINNQAKNQSVKSIGQIKSDESKCAGLASTNDFLKLRKNMVSKSSDEDMIYEAKKMFKKKCFTTEQVRSLGALFLSSDGKYQFFDAAYRHISDPEQFASLQSEIKDEYYVRRFKALIAE